MTTKKINKIKLILFFCILPFLVCSELESATYSNRPKLLLFSPIDLNYLAGTQKVWGTSTGINGFILAYVADWWSSENDLLSKLAILKKINTEGKIYGIDSNFIKVALSYGNDTVGSIPVWTDDKAWNKIIDNFRNIASLIKESGTKGIAIDTEYYNISIFNPISERYKLADQELLRKMVYQRGREIVQAMLSVHPDIEIIILQEGAYWADRNEKEYILWPDFYNGLASVQNTKGIIIGVESTYSLTDKKVLTEQYNKIDSTMKKYAQNKSFWRENCSIAIGMYPLGNEYNNKKARYSTVQFQEQLQTALSLSPQYVWLYGHGAAWWQMSPTEIKKYAGTRWVWGKEYQELPTDPLIQKYFSITKTR